MIWPNQRLLDLLGIDLPIIQAPMAGLATSAMVGYERFELRARLGPGNLEHAIASAAEVAASVFARWSHEALAFAQRVRAGDDGGPVRH